MKKSILYNLAIAAVVTVLFFMATHKVYRLPFSYGDDHRALAMLHPEKVSENYKAALYNNTPDWKGCFSIDWHIGRFRPLGWSYDKLLCIICGDNTHLFRLSNLFILFLSVFFLLCIFTTLEVDWLSALVVVAFYVFGRNNETWWTLIPPAQDIGECLLLAGIFVWLYYRKKGVTGFYVLPAFLFFLSSISKESFIFCIPVLLLTDYFFFSPAKKIVAKEYALSLLASILPFAGLLTTVLMIGKIYSYTYPESIWAIFGYNIFQFIGGAGFFFAPVCLYLLSRKALKMDFLLKLLAVFAIWSIIQLVLLKGIKLDDQHHYLIPWLLYPLILTGIAFNGLRKLSVKWFGVIVVVYGLAALLFAKNTYANSSSYSAQLKAYYNMLDKIKKDTAAPEIVYLGDNACLGDWINGTRVIMDNMGIKQPLYFATTAPFIPQWQMEYAMHSPQNAFKHIPLDSVFYPDGKWIIFIENPAKNGLMDADISFRKKDTVHEMPDTLDKNISTALYRKDSVFYIKINGKEMKILGKVYYFSMPYPGHSIGDILRGNNVSENRKGFYGIKLIDRRAEERMEMYLGRGC
jgi:hypothetical protein